MPRWEFRFAIALSAVFVLIYGSFYWQTWGMFNSPDENAVYVFTRHFIEEGSLTLARPDINEIAHPRSVNIRDGQFVPGSFIGWLLLLAYAGFLGSWLMALLPAFVAVGGAWAFWGIVRRVFGRETAWLSLLLLLTLPAWWYYASRGFLPNVPFVSFLLMAVFTLIKTGEAKDEKGIMAWLWAAAAGFCAGLALIIRPNEIIWVLLAALLWLPELRAIRPSRLLALVASVLPLVVTAYWQDQTFGRWYSTGYQSFAASVGEGAAAFSLSSVFFPFGFHPWAALGRFLSYQIMVMPWLLVAAVLGLVAMRVITNKTPEQKKYARMFALVFAYLLIYYGSWQFFDHPDQTRLTLGVSYGRYWLPIFVLAVPYVVMGCRALAARLRFGRWSLPLVLTLVFTLNTLSVYAFGDENLGQLRRNIVEYKQRQAFVFERTAPNAVIISERNDKVFWPGRQVIHYQPDDYTFLADAAKILPRAPVYLFTAIPRDHLSVIEQASYAPQGLSLQYVASFQQQSLYQVLSLNP